MQLSIYKKSLIGTILFSAGLAFLILNNYLPSYVFTSLFTLRPNSPFVGIWTKFPMPIVTDFYLFNWSNPADFYNPEVKPQFKEVGPYSFLQHVEKFNVIWNENDTVTFNQMRYFRFNRKGSIGNLTDNITTLNALTAGGAHHIRDWSFLAKQMISLFLQSIAAEIHVTKTADQLINDGDDNEIVKLSKYLPFMATEIPRVEKFSWLRFFNGSPTYEGVYNIKNGIEGHYDVLQWNYKNTSPAFQGACSKVQGVGGELYNRKLTKDRIGIFSAHLCRFLQFDFEKEVTVDGILGYKYSIDNSFLDNGTIIPGNECYCGTDCIPSGMISFSSCLFGTPLYGSLPHFYKADPVYLNAVQGLEPEMGKHESYFIIEPNTGLPLDVSMRIQFNILIHPVKNLRLYANVRKIYFPMFWVAQSAKLPNYLRVVLKIYLFGPYILIGIGCSILTATIYILFFNVINLKFTRLFKQMQGRHILLKYEDTRFSKQLEMKNETNNLLPNRDDSNTRKKSYKP